MIDVYAGELHTFDDHAEALADPARIAEMIERIKQGDAYLAREVIDREKLLKIREYLMQVGRSSLPNYAKIEQGAPNHHRLNFSDARSYVKGWFHQFTFFPWNQDVFNLFELAKPVYQMKNLLSGLPADKFQGMEPDDGCISRLSFQFYPSGAGYLNKHRDPVDHHQLVVPTMLLGRKGEDWSHGGAYVERADGELLMLDDQADIGDVLYFNAQLPHGVQPIDPEAELNHLDFRGRWMLLFAVNRLFGNTTISDAVDLES